MPDNPPTVAGRVLTRRGLVGVAGVTVLGGLAGCSPEGTSGPVLPVDPVADPDVALAVAAWAAELALLRQVRATGREHPGLRRRLEGARRAHAAHARVLARAVPTGDLPAVDDAPRPPQQAVAALRALARAEDSLARVQARRAMRARSGRLARVLAGTAAAAAQQAHLLEAAT